MTIGPNDLPAYSILEAVALARRDGETMVDAAQRLLLAEALFRTNGSQRLAADILKTTPTWVNHHAAKHGWRPRDVETDPAVAGAV